MQEQVLPKPETQPNGSAVMVSIVIPCLNEERTIGQVVHNARHALELMGLPGEVVVADNGSRDQSAAIARSSGARVVHVSRKGYGSALRGGIEAAYGRIIVMGDADGSHDFTEAVPMVQKILEGYDLVVGSRFKGTILPGSWSWTSRIGVPIVTAILNLLFKTGVSDSQCGFRAFTKDAYHRMQLRATGMEFASEMLIKAKKAGLRIAETPVTMHPDQRGRPPHLHPLRDGWRHLKLMLIYSPTVLFLLPGLLLMGIGFLLMFAQLFAPMDRPLQIGSFTMDFHWAIGGSLLMIVGYQVINTHFMAKIYSVTHDFQEQDRILEVGFRYLTAERVLTLSLITILIGLLVTGWALFDWYQRGAVRMLSGHTRIIIFGFTLLALGVQTFFNAFFFSILGDSWKRANRP